MQAAVASWAWSKLENVSYSHNSLVGLTSHGMNFESSNLYVPHGKTRMGFHTILQEKVGGDGKCFWLKYKLEINSRRYQSILCKVGNAQNDFSTLKKVFKEEEQKQWEACQEPLSNLNFSVEEVDVILGKAFGWVHSPYWGEEKTKTVPNKDVVAGALSYLESLGLSNVDLHKLLKKFPEVLGCSLENDLRNNVATLEREWGIKGNTLRNLILRNPKVLGYNVDCKGDCMAQCTRCWVRF
eukprot:Gb_41795 [translate_table: standard]